MKNEAPAHAGKEIASLIRAHHSGQRVGEEEVLAAFRRMLAGTATTTSDALALIVAARALMEVPISMVPPLSQSEEGLAVHCIFDLLNKAILALEIATGESEGTFTGRAPSMN